MFNKKRKGIYDYLYNLFYDVVTKNVYEMYEPQELIPDDTENGFIIISVGDINDESEFSNCAYGWARCYVQAYIPPKSRGRVNWDKYESFENGIDGVIENATANANANGTYHIQEGSVLSSDGEQVSNANNIFHTFIKSFIVFIDEEE